VYKNWTQVVVRPKKEANISRHSYLDKIHWGLIDQSEILDDRKNRWILTNLSCNAYNSQDKFGVIIHIIARTSSKSEYT
jgi:hypothetical protein